MWWQDFISKLCNWKWPQLANWAFFHYLLQPLSSILLSYLTSFHRIICFCQAFVLKAHNAVNGGNRKVKTLLVILAVSFYLVFMLSTNNFYSSKMLWNINNDQREALQKAFRAGNNNFHHWYRFCCWNLLLSLLQDPHYKTHLSLRSTQCEPRHMCVLVDKWKVKYNLSMKGCFTFQF